MRTEAEGGEVVCRWAKSTQGLGFKAEGNWVDTAKKLSC